MSLAVSLYGALVLLGPAEATGNPLASLNEHYAETTVEIRKESRRQDIELIVADKREKAAQARREAAEAEARAKAQREAERRREAQREAERHARSNRNSGNDSSSSVRGVGMDGGDVVVQASAINVEATYYTAFCDTGCTGVTATGIDVGSTIYHNGLRIIAVDPNVIPLGSVVEVVAGGATFKALAGDTGGAIKGNRIDILVGSKEEARKLGRTSASVRILNEG